MTVRVLSLACAVAFLLSGCEKVPNWRSHVSQVQQNHRDIATAIEQYYVDHNAYPPCTMEISDSIYEDSAHFRSHQRPDKLQFPTFRRGTEFTSGTEYLPEGGLTWYKTDPFSPSRMHPYGYFSTDDGWILVSVAPDKDFDVRPEDYSTSSGGRSERLIGLTYDPTNGVLSNGDLLRTKL